MGTRQVSTLVKIVKPIYGTQLKNSLLQLKQWKAGRGPYFPECRKRKKMLPASIRGAQPKA